MTVWDRIKGSRALEGLSRQIGSGDIAHAWLLLGPAGSGKRAAATAMAAALNCTDTPGVGCGRCSSCLRTLRNRYPDVHYVVPEGPLIPVDTIRESVIPEAARSPFEGRYKVFVIDEAERMNDAAQNALLKTLEEPEPDTVFILVSDQEEELLETIRSRCRVVRLEPVSEQRIVELLSGEGVSDETALLSARLSEGDAERARTLAFEAAATERRDFWTHIPRRLSSPVDALDAAAEIVAEAGEAVAARAEAQKTEVVELAEATGEGRGTAAARNALATRHRRELRRLEEEVLGDALQSLASFYRDVLAVRRGASDAAANLDLMGELEQWANSEAADDALLACVERCVVARGTLSKNANQLLAMEATLLELSRLAPAPARVGRGT
jgi:DNA polymerase III subunit delta'